MKYEGSIEEETFNIRCRLGPGDGDGVSRE
jgi:hypothetical protein